MKKVLLVIDHLGSGGAQRQMVGLANGLASIGYRVDLFIYYPEISHHLKNLDDKVNLLTANKTGRLGINVVRKLTKCMSESNYVSAIAFLNTPAVYLEIARVISLSKVNIYYSERSSFELVGGGILNSLRYWLHGLCKGICSNSMIQTEKLRIQFKDKDVRFIPNAIPSSFFQSKDYVTLWEKKSISVVSHTKPFKNYRYLAHALVSYKNLFEAEPPRIDWYGEIYSFNDVEQEMREVETLLSDAGLAGQIRFRGVVDDVPAVLSESSFLLHPSKYESSSNSVAEAMASSTPVICGNISDHPKLSEDIDGVFLVSLEDATTLATTLRKLLAIELEEYRKLCESVREFADNNYSTESVIGKYESFLFEASQ